MNRLGLALARSCSRTPLCQWGQGAKPKPDLASRFAAIAFRFSSSTSSTSSTTVSSSTSSSSSSYVASRGALGGGSGREGRGGGGGGGKPSKAAPVPANNGGILKNEDIKLPNMRVVYKNPETGANEWQVLTRKDALALAKKMNLDLVLVDGKSTPPVCRLDDFGQMLMEKRKKAKEKKTSQKMKSLKEIYVKAGIDPHDLEIKLKRCKDFLGDGHQVKIVLMATKIAMANNPLALDEATLKVLESIEGSVGTVQQPKASNPMRRDFLLNPARD